LDIGSETELGIQIKELVFENAYLSKVINEKKSWFTWMEVHDFIYHQLFFTATSLGVTTHYIAILSTSNTADISACGCSYSLCVLWVCHWNEGYSYGFSR
jgi:hypothetical protein